MQSVTESGFYSFLLLQTETIGNVLQAIFVLQACNVTKVHTSYTFI